MGKTSYNNMKELSDAISTKIGELESGDLAVTDLEDLVDDARELYERLLIVKFKAYEKFGEPQTAESDHEEEAEEVNEIIEEIEPPKPKKEQKDEVKEEILEDEGFDFSGITEDFEQPSFDFSASEETVEEVMEEKAEKRVEEAKATPFPEEEEEVDEAKEKFKDSHVERVEEEDHNSLNKKLKDSDDELSLRKQLQSTPIKDLRKEISIAKKFEYITFMFAGKNEIYEKAIESLNTCASGEDAKNKLSEFSTEHDWDLENKSIIKFVELVERRYL
jgi:hypothetical protein